MRSLRTLTHARPLAITFTRQSGPPRTERSSRAIQRHDSGAGPKTTRSSPKTAKNEAALSLYDPETAGIGGVVGPGAVVKRNAALSSSVVPSSSANNTPCSLVWTWRILSGMGIQLPLSVPVPAPLPSVPRHVKKTIPVGRIAPNRPRTFRTKIRILRCNFVGRGKLLAQATASRGFFPFGLRGQSESVRIPVDHHQVQILLPSFVHICQVPTFAGVLTRPQSFSFASCVAPLHGVVPVYMDHGMIV